MTKSGWIKLSGWAMAASSVLVVAGFMASSRPLYNEYNAASWPIDRYLNVSATPITLLGLLLIAFGLAGLKAYFGKSAGSLGQTGLNIGLIGIGVAIVGLVGQKIADSSPWWEALMLGITALFIGLLIFGIRCMQRNLFSHWNALVLIVGVIWPLVIVADILLSSIIVSDFQIPELLNVIFILAAFAGVGLIGYLLQADAGKARSELV